MKSATAGSNTRSVKYDPDGNRIERTVDDGTGATTRTYIVAVIDSLPVVLLELEGSTVKRSYAYANDELLCMYDGTFIEKDDPEPDVVPNRYDFVHDRLGSVRLILNEAGQAVASYVYDPFGNLIGPDAGDPCNIDNRWLFTGQYF